MYNFDTFDGIMSRIRTDVKPQHLSDLKDELNKFFRDSKCMEVIYTENDKMFFGMSVLPVIGQDYIVGLAKGDYKRFDKYYLELDSKLFNPLLKLTTRELVAILLHEVGHVVNSVKTSKEISDNINVIIAKNGVNFEYEEAQKYGPFFNVAIARSIRTLTSIFEMDQEEYIADDFVVKCGYGAELESAFDKIIKNREGINSGVKASKLTTLIWSLSIYRELGSRRREVLNTLEKSQTMEGSKLFANLYKDTYNFLKNFNIGFASIREAAGRAIIHESDLFKKLKFGMIKTVEDDLYEFEMHSKNIESSDEALDLLRSINLRIGIIDEYITSEAPEKSQLERLQKIQNKFKVMRENLIKNSAYKQKTYGLFVEYPVQK